MARTRSCHRVDEELFGVVKYYQNKELSTKQTAEKVGLGESTVQELYKTKNYEERLAYLREKAKERREKKEQAEQTTTPQPVLDVKEDSEIKGLLEQILDELKKLNEVWG